MGSSRRYVVIGELVRRSKTVLQNWNVRFTFLLIHCIYCNCLFTVQERHVKKSAVMNGTYRKSSLSPRPPPPPPPPLPQGFFLLLPSRGNWKGLLLVRVYCVCRFQTGPEKTAAPLAGCTCKLGIGLLGSWSANVPMFFFFSIGNIHRLVRLVFSLCKCAIQYLGWQLTRGWYAKEK